MGGRGRSANDELALTIKLLKLGDIGAFLNKAIEPPPLDAAAESVAEELANLL